MSQVSLGRPEFVPGTPPGHPTAKFLYVIFLYRFFSLHSQGDCEGRQRNVYVFCVYWLFLLPISVRKVHHLDIWG